MKQLIWLMIGFALASSVVGCIYRLGYLHGEIAALEIVELRRECAVHTVGARVPRARCPGTCGHAGRVTLPAMGFATGSER